MRKTLIIRACAIGDFVLNLPAITALHERYRDARITLVGNRSTLKLAGEFLPVDGIHSIDVQPWPRLFYEAIPELGFDSAVVWMKDSVVATYLVESGVPEVIRADPFPSFGHAADHLLRIRRRGISFCIPEAEVPRRIGLFLASCSFNCPRAACCLKICRL
jgi:hypothetical protein